LNNEDELLKIKVLIEESNIKYSNLKAEYYSKGVESMTLEDCKELLRKNVGSDRLEKIIKVWKLRKFIQINSNNDVFLVRNTDDGKGRHLDKEDEEVAALLFKTYRNYDSI